MAVTGGFEFQVPDSTRSASADSRWRPTGELIPFLPRRLEHGDVVGLSVVSARTNLGTYGMGGPGFFGLLLGSGAWLVVALWGAGGWILGDGRIVEDEWMEKDGRPQPWTASVDYIRDDLTPRIAGRAIADITVGRRSMRIALDDGFTLEIDEAADRRPVYGGSKARRVVSEGDDLRDAVFLAPTAELWVSARSK